MPVTIDSDLIRAGWWEVTVTIGGSYRRWFSVIREGKGKRMAWNVNEGGPILWQAPSLDEAKEWISGYVAGKLEPVPV